MQALAQADIQSSATAEAAKLKADNLKQAAQQVGQAFETAFKNATQPGANLLKTFEDLGRAIEDLILKALIFKPLEDSLTAAMSGGGSGGGIFGSIFSSIFSGAGSAAAPAASTGMFHSGGVVGSSVPMKSVSSAAFMGAPRMHNGGRLAGLGPDEIPIIAKLGETVTPAGKTPGAGSKAPMVFAPTYNITTPDAGSFGASQGQLMADAYRHMSGLAGRNT